MLSIADKWDQIHKASDFSAPADILLENYFLLPEKGCALDLACGLGANALFLAEKGLDTHAWDVSKVALNRLQERSVHKELKITLKQLHISSCDLAKNRFDVVVLTHFLDRTLCNAIMESLKPSGLLFYQTYVRDKLGSSGPKNKQFLLARNELLQLFSPLTVVMYRENNLLGDLQYGDRNEAFFVGQKC